MFNIYIPSTLEVIISKTVMAREMVQGALAGTLSSVPSTRVGGSQLPVTSTSGDHTPLVSVGI